MAFYMSFLHPLNSICHAEGLQACAFLNPSGTAEVRACLVHPWPACCQQLFLLVCWLVHPDMAQARFFPPVGPWARSLISCGMARTAPWARVSAQTCFRTCTGRLTTLLQRLLT